MRTLMVPVGAKLTVPPGDSCPMLCAKTLLCVGVDGRTGAEVADEREEVVEENVGALISASAAADPAAENDNLKSSGEPNFVT